MIYRLGFCVCLLTFAVAACNGTMLHAGPPSQNANTSQKDQAVFSLDLQNPEIKQKIVAGDDPAKARFVQIEVVKITNPRKRPAQFEVRYQPDAGEKILLGSFSLYPPDNPGKFIVPTQGKVKAEGMLILSLVKSDQVVAGDVVEVSVRPMRLVNSYHVDRGSFCLVTCAHVQISRRTHFIGRSAGAKCCVEFARAAAATRIYRAP
jgi:hypothetical protein